MSKTKGKVKMNYLKITFAFLLFTFYLISRRVFDQNQIAVVDGADDEKFFAVVRPGEVRDVARREIGQRFLGLFIVERLAPEIIDARFIEISQGFAVGRKFEFGIDIRFEFLDAAVDLFAVEGNDRDFRLDVRVVYIILKRVKSQQFAVRRESREEFGSRRFRQDRYGFAAFDGDFHETRFSGVAGRAHKNHVAAVSGDL